MSSTDFSDAEVLLELREKDRHILAAIQQGYDNVRALNKELAYNRDEINYSLKQKLALDGLVTLQTPDGWRTETMNGRIRRYKAPKQATITDHGIRYLEETEQERTPPTDMSHVELVQTVHDLEHRVETLETGFQQFRRQVMQLLGDRE
jgi:hypothetical protein